LYFHGMSKGNPIKYTAMKIKYTAMKRKIILASAGILLLAYPAWTQDCTFFYPMEKGTIIELQHFDSKAKLSGTTRQEIVDKQIHDGAITLTIKNTFLDKKGKELMTSDLTMECRDGVFTFDMDQYLNEEMLAGMKNMKFTIEGDNLEFPSSMKVGEKLRDGTIKLLVKDMPMMNMSTTVYNRKVEAIEEVTTKAGTFECYKISYDILTDAIIDIQSSAIEWIARDVGAVRTESYDQNGKLAGYSELVSLEK
jgi:hypothetical protein